MPLYIFLLIPEFYFIRKMRYNEIDSLQKKGGFSWVEMIEMGQFAAVLAK